MTGTHDIDMTVGLKIPDTTAITAFKALQRMGIKELKSLKRHQYYRFRVSGDPSSAAEQLGRTDIIVNANKNTFFTKPAGDPFPQEDTGLFTIRVLVKDLENSDRGLPQVMRQRLGMGFVESAETGVLWTMGFDAERERAWKIARDLGNRFFANLNYQEARFLESAGGPQVLMLFGSQSDEPIYSRIAEELDKEGVQHEMKVCSAHRSPKLLDRILGEYRPSVIIAGAGLAAHLPGVVASKTIRPVIGVPCDGNYQGLDAMLSIMQMPPGIPVLGVGVNKAHAAASAAAMMMRDYEAVNIIGDREHRRVKACSDMLKQFGALHEFSKDIKKDAVNIRFFQMGDYSKPDTNALVINVPMTDSNSAEDALRVMSMAKDGLWVGLNRGDNAAIAALQILAISGKYVKELEAQRREMERKLEELYRPRSGETYKASGVDIDAGNESVRRIREHVKRTFTPDVRMDIGKFGGAISASRLKSMEDPVLVSSIDGVGTKVMVAGMMGKWDTVGKDIVNHSVGDILTTGAEPMFFLDYIANEKLEPQAIEQIVKGMSEACIEAGAALVGGETAEMPGTYMKGEKDIAGCIVGTVERGRMIDGSKIKEGDALIGISSNGLHTNGYSLARKVLFGKAGYSVSDRPEELGGETVGEALLKPHTLYSKAVLPLLKQFDIRGIAHITGGGLVDNTPRVFPEGLSATIKKGSLPVPPVFTLIQKKGSVPEADMYRAFNMGVGMVLVAPQHQAQQIVQTINSSGLKSNLIGRMVKGDFGVRLE